MERSILETGSDRPDPEDARSEDGGRRSMSIWIDDVRPTGKEGTCQEKDAAHVELSGDTQRIGQDVPRKSCSSATDPGKGESRLDIPRGTLQGDLQRINPQHESGK